MREGTYVSMRISNRTIIFGGKHSVPENWDVIIRCVLKPGDRILKPWGEWKRIPKNMYGINTRHTSWSGTYIIRKRPQVDPKIQRLIEIALSPK